MANTYSSPTRVDFEGIALCEQRMRKLFMHAYKCRFLALTPSMSPLVRVHIIPDDNCKPRVRRRKLKRTNRWLRSQARNGTASCGA
jgi:hypothetical protein